MTKAGYSLRQQLIVRTALLMTLVFVILSAGVWDYARRAADISFDRLLNSASLSILERVTVSNGQIDLDLPYAALSMLELAPSDKVFYEVIDHNGQHLTGHKNIPSPNDYRPHNEPEFYTANYRGEALSLVAQSKRLIAPEAHGWVTIKLGQTRLARQELADEIFYSAIATLLGILLLTLILVWLGVRRALEPLSTLSQKLKSHSATQHHNVEATPIHEIAPLVDAINSYQQQLINNLDTMKVFIADASHQIRSSLGGLQGQLDIALQTDDQHEMSARLKKIKDQLQQLTRLANQLLAHALVTHRSDTQEPQIIDINILMQSVLTEVVRDHAHTDIEFSYHADETDCKLLGDNISLREAIKNLLDNAIKYGPPNNHIDIVLTHKTAAEFIIQIDDSGPGIPAYMRRQALQRFTRLSQKTTGSGLGLAIVETVVQAHNGILTLSTNARGGLTVTIQLPKSTAS